MRPIAKNPDLAQRLLVHWNFLRVVLPQFKVSIGVFLIVNLWGSLVIWSYQPHITYPHAAYTALALNTFEVSEKYPEGHGFWIQAVYFVLPVVGLLVIAEGVVRLGVVIFHRKQLSREWHMALAQSFKDHVVIAGLGKIGERVARNLQNTEQLACIEQGEKIPLLSENVAIIRGDATKPEVLEQVNLKQARAIMALTDNDLANLEIALAAREVKPDIRVVLRMFNEALGKRLVEKFDFQACYSTSSLAAPSFSSALYSSRILQTIEVGPNKRLHMARVVVVPGSPLVGRTIIEVEKAESISVVLHHHEGTTSLLPDIESPISANDELYVLAELKPLDAFDAKARASG